MYNIIITIANNEFLFTYGLKSGNYEQKENFIDTNRSWLDLFKKTEGIE